MHDLYVALQTKPDALSGTYLLDAIDSRNHSYYTVMIRNKPVFLEVLPVSNQQSRLHLLSGPIRTLRDQDALRVLRMRCEHLRHANTQSVERKLLPPITTILPIDPILQKTKQHSVQRLMHRPPIPSKINESAVLQGTLRRNDVYQPHDASHV